jgi:hypothetical protein
LSNAVLDRLPLREIDSDWIMLDRVVEYASQDEMRFGPSSYTPEQRAFMRGVVSRRRPLPASAPKLAD